MAFELWPFIVTVQTSIFGARQHSKLAALGPFNSMASTAFSSSPRLRVGIVGYGSVGQYFVDRILNDPAVSAKLELAFVWNRTASKIPVEGTGAVPTGLILTDLNDFASRKADMIVELSHPSIAKNHGEAFVSSGSDFFVGSPTAFADPEADAILRKAAG